MSEWCFMTICRLIERRWTWIPLAFRRAGSLFFSTSRTSSPLYSPEEGDGRRKGKEEGKGGGEGARRRREEKMREMKIGEGVLSSECNATPSLPFMMTSCSSEAAVRLWGP